MASELKKKLAQCERQQQQLSDAKRIVFKGVAKKGGYHPVDSSD